MAKIETAIREAIVRGSRRETRTVAGPLRREVRRLRRTVGELRREVTALRETAQHWERTVRATPWRPEVSEEEVRAARLSSRLIRALRRRLGLSQAEVGRLLRVSPTAVVQWEQGRSAPSGPNRAALVGLRRLGRREVRRLLAAAPATTRRPRARPKGRRSRQARRRRTGR